MTSIWLDPAARATISSEARRFRFRETGGPVFGFGDDEALVVVAVGGPGPRARHRPMSFRPDPEAVKRAIDYVWEAGDQRYRYLGSWHTHPRGRAVPSGRDRATAREMAEAEDLLLPQPLILIQSAWPGRRVIRDSDLRGYRWDPAENDLAEVVLRTLGDSERQWPLLEVQVE